MISLAQFVNGSAEEMTVKELKRLLYQIADSDGDALAMKLIAKELEKREWQD